MTDTPWPRKTNFLCSQTLERTVTGTLLCRRENRSDDAIRMWERCISLDPQYASAYLWLAQLEGPERAGELLRALNLRSGPCPKHRAAFADWLLSRGEDTVCTARRVHLQVMGNRVCENARPARAPLQQRGRVDDGIAAPDWWTR